MKSNQSIKPDLQARTFPFALLLLCFISFGLLIPWLGFYWDDWPAIWFLHLFGPAGFGEVFAVDRPLLGWIFMLTTRLFGESTLGWQFFGLLTRWASCLAFWWLLRGVWPRRAEQAIWATLLFAIYPGFRQQYISVTYSNGWILLASFLLSLGWMIWAIRKPRWYWPLMTGSWLLSAFTMFSSEYFFGLELLRPVFLWLVHAEQAAPQRLRRIAREWAPYLVIMALFLVWRVLLTETPRGQVQIFDELRTAPAATLITLLKTILEDMGEASLLAWAETVKFTQLARFGLLPTLLYVGIVLAATALAVFYLAKLHFDPDPKAASPASAKGWAVQAILLGMIALFLAGWPFWVTKLPIALRFPWDRFTLTMMLGTSLLLVGLIELLINNRLAKVVLLGTAIGLAVGLHFQTANLYRRDWNYQKSFFWQLAWRAPGVKPGTMFLTSELPFDYFTDNSLTAPLNWLYAPASSAHEMPFLLYSVQSRFGTRLIGFSKGLPVQQPYRSMSFSGSTSQALVVYFAPPGCVKIVDPAVDPTLPQKPQYISEMMPLSDLSLVLAEPIQPARPPEGILGPEPERNWCYYFEKADLARQMGDWEQVADLGDQAFGLNERLYEVNAPELIPYIEGYARVGQWERAEKLSREAYQLSSRMQRMVCSTWKRIASSTPESPEKQAAINNIQDKLKCTLQ